MGEGPPMRAYFIGVDQKIPGCSIKVVFLGEAKIAVRSSIKSRSDIIYGP